MSISIVSTGTGTLGTAAAHTANYPATITAGDLLVMIVHIKPGGNGLTAGTMDTPTDWTLLGTFRSEGGNQSADSGDTTLYAFSKLADGTESGTVALSGTTINQWVADIFCLQSSIGAEWQTGFATGEKTTTGAAAIAMSSNPGIAADDFLFAAFMSVSDANGPAFSAPSITATGATISTPTERRNTYTSTGSDSSAYTVSAPVTAGPATDVPSFNFTCAAGNHIGAAAIVRVRESATSATVTRLWSGRVDSGAGYVGALLTGGTDARLKVSTTVDLLTSPVYGGSATVDADGYVQLSITGLSADTTYYYAVEIDTVLDDSKVGSFKTAPSGASNFSFVFGSCNSSGIASDAYARMIARSPDLFFQLGDFHYDDIDSTDATLYHAAVEQQFTKADDFDQLVQTVPTMYLWSDHDYCGNNSNENNTGKATVQAAYRQMVPSGPLVVSDGIYYTFVYGRVRFIMTDMRSFKSEQTNTDDASKTVLGATQKTWFKDTIDAATEPLILWMGDIPWTDEAGATDEWANYDTERQELATHISGSGKHVVYLHGDSHAVGANDGTTGSPGSLECILASPFHRYGASNKGTYTSGPYPVVPHSGSIYQYGHISITDDGTDISLVYNGYDSSDVSQATLTVTESSAASGTASASATSAITSTGAKSTAGSATVSAASSSISSTGVRHSGGSAAASTSSSISTTGGKGGVGTASVAASNSSVASTGAKRFASTAAASSLTSLSSTGHKVGAGQGVTLGATSSDSATGTKAGFGSASASAASTITSAGFDSTPAESGTGTASVTVSSSLSVTGAKTVAGSAATGATSSGPTSNGTKIGSGSVTSTPATSSTASSGVKAGAGTASASAASSISSTGVAIVAGAGTITVSASSSISSSGAKKANGVTTLTSVTAVSALGAKDGLGTAQASATSSVTGSGSAPLQAGSGTASATASTSVGSTGVKGASGVAAASGVGSGIATGFTARVGQASTGVTGTALVQGVKSVSGVAAASATSSTGATGLNPVNVGIVVPSPGISFLNPPTSLAFANKRAGLYRATEGADLEHL